MRLISARGPGRRGSHRVRSAAGNGAGLGSERALSCESRSDGWSRKPKKAKDALAGRIQGQLRQLRRGDGRSLEQALTIKVHRQSCARQCAGISCSTGDDELPRYRNEATADLQHSKVHCPIWIKKDVLQRTKRLAGNITRRNTGNCEENRAGPNCGLRIGSSLRSDVSGRSRCRYILGALGAALNAEGRYPIRASLLRER